MDLITSWLSNDGSTEEFVKHVPRWFSLTHHGRILSWCVEIEIFECRMLNLLLATDENAAFIGCCFGRRASHSHNNSNYLPLFILVLFILVLFIFSRVTSCPAWAPSCTAETNPTSSPNRPEKSSSSAVYPHLPHALNTHSALAPKATRQKHSHGEELLRRTEDTH